MNKLDLHENNSYLHLVLIKHSLCIIIAAEASCGVHSPFAVFIKPSLCIIAKAEASCRVHIPYAVFIKHSLCIIVEDEASCGVHSPCTSYPHSTSVIAAEVSCKAYNYIPPTLHDVFFNLIFTLNVSAYFIPYKNRPRSPFTQFNRWVWWRQLGVICQFAKPLNLVISTGICFHLEKQLFVLLALTRHAGS